MGYIQRHLSIMCKGNVVEFPIVLSVNKKKYTTKGNESNKSKSNSNCDDTD